LTLAGQAGNDIYQFDTDSSLGTIRLDESSGGVDTIDFGRTTSLPVNLNLGVATPQVVNANLTLQLNATSTFENATCGSQHDLLIGNAGNNILRGNGGNDILVGNNGNDELLGGSGSDLLIGGLGLDVIKGEGGSDILIAGRTKSDSSVSKLSDLRTEWTSAKSYATRIANLRAGVGTSGASLKKKNNVLNDAGEDDILTGGGVATGDAADWYFRAVDDVLTDLASGELIDVL
jgi:Ca2+-binding RTX toxin-like protein